MLKSIELGGIQMIDKEQLTNEILKKRFKDNFALAQFVINVARHLVKAGHEVNIPQLLKDIQQNPDLYTPEYLESLEKVEKSGVETE